MSELVDLRSGRIFPTFRQCPEENEINLAFYESEDQFYYRPSHHWCLLAEIVESSFFLRLRLQARDREGQEFPIAFYLDNDLHLDPESFKIGSTVAILYAHQHGFLDMSVGIRQETLDTICVFPTSLKRLMSLNDKVQLHAPCTKNESTCHGCGEKSQSLSSCGSCKLFKYCGKECQTKAWKSCGHREDCRLLRSIGSLFCTNWEEFAEYKGFPLSKSLI